MTTFTIYTANTTGAQQNTVYPNEETVDNLSALEQAMRRDHVCAKYTGNVRGVANFQYADCIPMDCDNDHSDNPDDWKSPEDVKKAFRRLADQTNGRLARGTDGEEAVITLPDYDNCRLVLKAIN